VEVSVTEATMIDDPTRGVRLEVLSAGEGEPVVLVPSALRGATDFARLQNHLTEAGYNSLALNPRGVANSTPPPADISLRDLADDVALVVQQLGSGRAHLVGHALGNVVVRATASYRPEVAATVAVMPCGGHNLGAHPVAPEVLAAFARCHDVSLSDEERLDALRVAFFAPGNDPRSWLGGWWPTSSFGAVTQTDSEEWWRAGNAPMLIIQPLDDAMAPTAVGRDAAAALGDRATYVEVSSCGHAILPEQPEAIAEHVTAFLRAHPLEPS
jgi:pimeloyl-ACP methyl ester carboxylesterase